MIMNESALVLEISREEQKVKVSVFEKSDGAERTLRQYEDWAVAWDEVETNRREVINLLNRANKRARVTTEILDTLRKSGQLLFDLLIPPKARTKLVSSTAQNLTLYVDDKLVHIPWELLFTGREFLCRRFSMGRIVSTRQAPTSLSTRKLTAPLNVLVLSDPRGDLAASYREGIEIRNFLDGKADAFRVNFKSHPVDIPYVKKNLRDYDIVHYAGHADYHSENPAESGWLLSGGRLKASEISAMGGLQPMPSLVFSNACQTGQTGEWQIQDGYEQQIFGLANAYLLSGVQHYIGTFWEILDEPSLCFAKSFYGFLANGENIGEAVRRAREELIKAYGEETVVWASYMLYGDPTFSLASSETEPVTETAAVQSRPVEWSQVMRGEESVALPLPNRSRRFPLRSSLLIIFLLGLVFSGYRLFYPHEKQEEKLASVSASVENFSKAKEIETDANVSSKTEVRDEPQLEGMKKETQIAKVKGLVPAPKALDAAVLPAAKPQEGGPIAPTKEQVAVVKEPAALTDMAPLSLRMNIIGQRKEADGSYTEVLVSEGSVLRSYDNFQVHLETNKPAFVYVLLYDSEGKASQLFPDPKIDHPGYLQPGSRSAIPSRDLWFWLDEHAGTETIYVLTSEKPLTDIRSLLAQMEGGDEAGQKRVAQEIKERIAVMQRGVGGITKGQSVTYTLSDGKKIQKVTDVLTGTGSVVRAVSFQHRYLRNK
jgi:CHAT domain-containing protein